MTPVLEMARAEDVPLDYWRNNVAEFIDRCLINPETGEPFVLLPAERLFLKWMFMTDADGRLLYPTLVYSAIKKSGKTTFGAMVVIVMMVLFAPQYGEAYVLANDFAQAQNRVFDVCCRIVQSSPMLRHEARVTSELITFHATKSIIRPLSSDYGSAAGGHPTIAVFDEIWNYTTARARRLWDELVPVPTRKISCRLIVSHAGFLGESELFEGLYHRGKALPKVGPDLYAGDGMLMFWSHVPIAPEQTPAWLEQMRRDVPAVQFLRQFENRFAASERSFIDMAKWDACCDASVPMVDYDKALPVTVGVDIGYKHDSTAIVTTTWEPKLDRVRLVRHKIIQPSPDNPLDFESAVEGTLLDLQKRFIVERVLFDPWQMQATAQRLKKAGLQIEEFPQSPGNLTAASQGLFDLISSRRLVMYPDEDTRLAASRAIAKEMPRGCWRIAKDQQNYKIDVVVALAMSAHAAVTNQSSYIRDWSRWL
jgi:phage terminase large subunit-like protein